MGNKTASRTPTQKHGKPNHCKMLLILYCFSALVHITRIRIHIYIYICIYVYIYIYIYIYIIPQNQILIIEVC